MAVRKAPGFSVRVGEKLYARMVMAAIAEGVSTGHYAEKWLEAAVTQSEVQMKEADYKADVEKRLKEKKPTLMRHEYFGVKHPDGNR